VKKIGAKDFSRVVQRYSDLLGEILLQTGKQDSVDVLKEAKFLLNFFTTLQEDASLSLVTVKEAFGTMEKAESDLKIMETRIEQELVQDARILLSTIGSSHRLPVASVENIDESDDVTLDPPQASQVTRAPTIVVFDEAGCIPCHEFLGLSRLGREINALICVGDKNQLPPYNPIFKSPTCFKPPPCKRQRRQYAPPIPPSDDQLPSLLDVSGDSVSKIQLTAQYRVPQDIARILSVRVYNGCYNTAPSCSAPLKGFHLVHVPIRGPSTQKYVNHAEVQKCMELLDQVRRDGVESCMLLTPVRIFVPNMIQVHTL
jgi:hypothetical protein